MNGRTHGYIAMGIIFESLVNIGAQFKEMSFYRKDTEPFVNTCNEIIMKCYV